MTSVVRFSVGERREPPLELGGRVPAAHRAEHAVVARLERNVQVR